MPGLFRSKTFYAVVVAGVATLVLLGTTRVERPAVSRAESWLSDALSPLQSVSSRAVRGVSSAFGAVAELGRLRSENQYLRDVLAQRPGLQSQLEELRVENEQLRQQLGLVQHSPLRYKPADVIGRSSDNWFATVTISRGSGDGVTRDMAVVTEQGLVGRVFKVTGRTATVLLLTDRDSGTGSLVANSRDAGIARGQDQDELQLRFFNPEAQVEVGDQVLTSGLNSLFPKGIPVGQVTQVTTQGLVKEASLRPAVDFHHLERVLVVTWSPADGMGLPPLPAPSAAETGQPAPPPPGVTTP
ncbi:MAG: rod shape-determining protein MreC [Firmicutes bacterium]|nr:rod shape-determining protein MreC [Bacillota bacterium]